MLKWILLALVALLLAAWAGISVLVQIPRSSPLESLGQGFRGRALILWHRNPIDPFLENVTRAFADGLANRGWTVERTTYHASLAFDPGRYDLIVIATNTFNWSPDFPTKRFLAGTKALSGTPVVAIVTGFGSTGRAERITRELLEASGARVLDVRPFWEMRPNDESHMDRPNREAAFDLARRWGQELAGSLHSD
jgi:hypothetical protein